MATCFMPSTKLFKKCSIITNNPVYKELFLIFKKMNLYCINIKNKSIKKVKTLIELYDTEIKYSSNGEYFIIAEIYEINNKFFVYNSHTLELMNEFKLSSKSVNIDTLYSEHFDSNISDILVYNEFLICNIKYEIDPYISDEPLPVTSYNGIEVYNILTGKLVTNRINLNISILGVTNTGDIYCSLNSNPRELLNITPDLTITKLPYSRHVLLKSNLLTRFIFNNTLILLSTNTDSIITTTVLTQDKTITTSIHLGFRIPHIHIIYKFIHSPDNKYLFLCMHSYAINYTRIIVLNNSASKCLFWFDIKSCFTFTNISIVNDYRVICEYSNSVYSIDSPLTKILYTLKIIEDKPMFYLPNELWDKIIHAF